jgi:hypothetical protein
MTRRDHHFNGRAADPADVTVLRVTPEFIIESERERTIYVAGCAPVALARAPSPSHDHSDTYRSLKA